MSYPGLYKSEETAGLYLVPARGRKRVPLHALLCCLASWSSPVSILPSLPRHRLGWSPALVLRESRPLCDQSRRTSPAQLPHSYSSRL